jgi:thiol-disulfide isomerase/thioredoxin
MNRDRQLGRPAMPLCSSQRTEQRDSAAENATADEQVLGSDVAVIVDDWAAWCGPCRLLGPVISQR